MEIIREMSTFDSNCHVLRCPIHQSFHWHDKYELCRCLDDCDFLILPDHVSGELGLYAHFLCGVSDESFETSDGNSFTLDTADALCLALRFLGADTTAYCRQRRRLRDYFVSAFDVAVFYLGDECGNVDINGAP